VASAGLDIGKWHHLTGTYDGSLLKIYVDGVKEADCDYGPNQRGICWDAYIGHDMPGFDTSFEGKINDVRVYNYALDVDEINFVMWDGLFPNTHRFRINNSEDETVAWFDDLGNLFLKGEKLTVAEDPIPSGSFVVKNSGDQTVAYISNQGNLWIAGGISYGGCNPTGDAFIIKNSENSVAYIDLANGNLCLTGELYEKPGQ
jgi:hypothetical protein